MTSDHGWNGYFGFRFGEDPIEQYLDRYDLIIMDHPFVGFVAAHECSR